jgi:flagellar hook-associated protein 1
VQSSFAGIELGKRSLVAHTQGLQTVGHNLSNASVEGYSRQRVRMAAFDPLYDPALNREERPGQIGQGVTVQTVERIRDQILEGRIVGQANEMGYWEARDKYMLLVEQVYNEPTELSVRSLMDKFWESWQELSIYPEEFPARRAVLERGQALIDGIHGRFRGLTEIRDMLELEVTAGVERVNAILSEISVLNEQIVKVEAMGDNPNDLLDKRDLFVKELSGLIDITVDGRDPDEFTIHTGGLHLLQGRVVNPLRLEPNPDNEGYSDVLWAKNGEEAYFRGGKLAAYVGLRDGDLRSEIQKLDMMTINFIDLVNEVHREGYGSTGEAGLDFFTEYPAINNLLGNYDRSGDGEFDSSYIFRITGIHSLNPQEQIGLRGTLTLSAGNGDVDVEYYPTDTVADLIGRINTSGSEVMARLDRAGRLSLKGAPAQEEQNPDFVIRHIEDSGQFFAGYSGILNASGPEGAYDWGGPDAVLALRGGDLEYAVAPLAHPAGWIEVNRQLNTDPGRIAAGFGVNGRPAEPGDGSAALAIASLRHDEVMIGRIPTFDEFFADTIASAGLRGETAARALETEGLIMKELEDMRQAISGVNIDEELAQMIKFQHGYNAASRFISEINTLLDTIINRMGA